MAQDESPFAELPAALVEEVLACTAAVGDSLLASFRTLKKDREVLRHDLENQGLLLHESSLGYPPPSDYMRRRSGSSTSTVAPTVPVRRITSGASARLDPGNQC